MKTRTRFVNEAEEEMSFPFCAPKEDNEVEENDERLFLENMRSPFVNEVKNEKLSVLEKKKKKRRAFLSQSTILFCFLTGGIYLQIWGLF